MKKNDPAKDTGTLISGRNESPWLEEFYITLEKCEQASPLCVSLVNRSVFC